MARQDIREVLYFSTIETRKKGKEGELKKKRDSIRLKASSAKSLSRATLNGAVHVVSCRDCRSNGNTYRRTAGLISSWSVRQAAQPWV